MTSGVGGGNNPWVAPGSMEALVDFSKIGGTIQDRVDSFEVFQQTGLLPNQDFLNKLSADKPGIPALSLAYRSGVKDILNNPNLTPEEKATAVKNLQSVISGALSFTEDAEVTAGVVKLLKTNPFLAVNMMVALCMNLTEMAQMLKESKMVELEAKLTGMNMVWESGLNIAALGISAAKAEAAMKFLEGAVGLCQASCSVVTAGMAGAGASGKCPKMGLFMGTMGGGTSLSSISSGLGQAITGFVNSGLIMTKAEQEALKSISETLKTLQQQTLQSAGEAMSDLEGLLSKALEMMQRIWEANVRAQQSLTAK